MTDGVAPPRGAGLLVVTAPVKEDLAIAVNVALVEDHEELVRLDDLPRIRIDARSAHREAKAFRVVLAFVIHALLENLGGGGEHWDVGRSQVAGDVVRVALAGFAAGIAGAIAWRMVNTREVRFAVGSARSGLALGRARSSAESPKVLS